MKFKDCKVKTAKRYNEVSLAIEERLRESKLVNQGLTEKNSVKEAQRCLGSNYCESCELCRLLCPDLCVTWNEKTGGMEIDYDYCKGCGICAAICPKGAIVMELEG